MKKQHYMYTKMFSVTEGHQVKLSVPTPLVRDFWKLEPGDLVVVHVDNNNVYTVKPVK